MALPLLLHLAIDKEDTFYKKYFEYIGDSECPVLYHRWTVVSMIGSLLGRQFYLPFGHDMIYPNQYILLVGDPGTRKGTALNPGKTILGKSGYKSFAPNRISPERFIAEMALSRHALSDDAEIEELDNLTMDAPSEIYACIGEFSDFIGSSNVDFIKLLTNLWDNLPEYKHPKLTSKSIYVYKPTVNILGGITTQNIATDIPVEALGQGFMSRFILVFGESTGIKISFPEPPAPNLVAYMSNRLKKIKETVTGECTIPPDVKEIAGRIYKEFIELDDFRFRYYSTRRFTHILKLAMIFSAMDLRTELSSQDFIQANTLLHYTEQKMPKALGEFGKAKNADVANNVMTLIRNAKKPILLKEIYKRVSNDIGKQSDLADILTSFRQAGKIRVVEDANGKQGFLCHSEYKTAWAPELLDESFLTTMEKI